MLARFFKHRSGSVMPMLALSFVPIMAAVAGAVDYSHASWVKSSLQDAVDATALMLAKNATNQTPAQLQTSATSFFLRQLHPHRRAEPAGHRNLQPVADRRFHCQCHRHGHGQDQFHERARHLAIADFDREHRELEQRQAARRAGARQHRLDGRRQQDRRAQDRDPQSARPSCKSAAQQNGDVYVSIIPFVQGRQRRRRATTTQAWIDWTDWDANNGTCSNTHLHDQEHLRRAHGT